MKPFGAIGEYVHSLDFHTPGDVQKGIGEARLAVLSLLLAGSAIFLATPTTNTSNASGDTSKKSASQSIEQ